MEKHETITIIIIVLVMIGVFIMIAFASNEYMNSQREKANDLGCEWDYDEFCYKLDSAGDLVRYEMKYLNKGWKLVRG